MQIQYIICGMRKRRIRSGLYLFNSFGMPSVYIEGVSLNFISYSFPASLPLRNQSTNTTSRITRMEDGQCIIDMKSVTMIPLILYDAVFNVYLTNTFLVPLKSVFTARGTWAVC